VRGAVGVVRMIVVLAVLASIPPARVGAGRQHEATRAFGLDTPEPVASPSPLAPLECVSSPGVSERGDVVIGTDGDDRIDCGGAAGGKVILGQGGDDVIIGSPRPDRILGGNGDDTLAGARGRDLLDGGPGADSASFRAARQGVTVDLGAGTATGEGRDTVASVYRIAGSRHDDILIGSPGRDVLRGGRGDDSIEALDGGDTLLGERGNDTLIGGPGDDRIDGGSSRDACARGEGRGTEKACEALPIGEAMSVTLFAPAESVVGVGFHESLFDTALEIRPNGQLTINANPSKFVPPDQETDGIEYVVMGSRGRPTPATSSVDVVVDTSSPVLSPVTGTVVRLFRYLLYCEAWDWELVIEPTGHPDARVIVLHFVDPQVGPGDRVLASVSPVGTSWTNDSPGAQENTVFPDQYPHVHVEVDVKAETPIPGCLPES
jgi:hypothetical protein